MLDAKQLRTDIDNIATQLAKRGFTLDIATLNALEDQRKAIQVKTQYSLKIHWSSKSTW